MTGDTLFEKHLGKVLIAQNLKPARRRGLYVIERDGNLGLLGVWRGQWTTASALQVKIDLAVVSGRLAAVFGEPLVIEWPKWEHHWTGSLDDLHPPSGISPWEAVSRAPGTSWAPAITDLRERVVPLLLEHLSDEGLMTCWSTHEDHWYLLPPAARLIYLALLQRDLSPPEMFRNTLASLRKRIAARGLDTPGARWRAAGLRSLGIDAR